MVDSNNTPGMPRKLVALFACTSGVSVANVYFAQPLLDSLAADFGVSAAAIGGVVTATQAGVVVGLLLARVWSGVVADLVGWRGVYAGSAVVMTVLAALVWRQLPAQPVKSSGLSYLQLVRSTLGLLATDRVLRVRGTLALLRFAAFSIFWSALALPLTQAPLSLSHSAVGAFGLLGAVGAFFAGRAGRWADRGWSQRTSAAALGLLLFAWLPLSFTEVSLWWLVVGILLLDVGCQALHVTNQALILRGPAESYGRLVGCYMLFYAVGSGAGAIASTTVYAHAGWVGVCILGASVSMLALVVWAVTATWPRLAVAPAS